MESFIRFEWDSYDLETEDNIKIEIKSSAYIQTWKQNKYSSISFNIAPTRKLLDNNNYSKVLRRQSDIYIFCLLHHKNQNSINPLNLEQWTFYLVFTSELDKKIPSQKTIRLSTIEKLEHIKCSYKKLKKQFEKMKIIP